MDADFYLPNRRALAQYFEKDWFDHALAQGCVPAFDFTPSDPMSFYSDSHEKVSAFLAGAIRDRSLAPERLLEVGAALGRGFYELYRRTPSVRAATLVEPSQGLAGAFETLFLRPGLHRYPVLSGLEGLVEVGFDSTHLAASVQGVQVSLLNTGHEHLDVPPGTFDLVTCFNVLSQCHEPLALVELLKRATAPRGILALSCTYGWNSKFVGTGALPTKNINTLFGGGWTHVDETNVEFKLRKYERHWWQFLSHVTVFQKE
jgi:SAM-dependent methyltransferase